MRGEGNADTNRGERKMEGEDSVRTLDCLRGRLLAERAASRNAKEEADQLGNKLIELENLLKQETKSRIRAEKKLKFLMKKLESINISYVSDESDYSALMDKNDISSISSTTSSTLKQQEENHENHHNTQISKEFKTEENAISHKQLKNSQQIDPRSCLFTLSDDGYTAEGTSNSSFEVDLVELKGEEREMGRNEYPLLPRSSEIFVQNIGQNATVEDSLSSKKSTSKIDQQSDICNESVRSSADEGLNEEDDHNPNDQTDDSMALMVVDTPQKNRTVDPEVLDATVKEVLDALRYAKEQLQSSMERRRMNMIRVG